MTLARGFLSADLEWLASDDADPVERATAAELSIVADGLYLTEVDDLLAKTVRSRVRLSGHRLAGWLAQNWWRLRWEPRSETLGWRLAHRLPAAGGGFVWPDITFDTDGERVMLQARQTRASSAIRYLVDYDTTVAAADFERFVDGLVTPVVERLRAMGHADANLVLLWSEVLEERRDPHLSRARKLEAMAGYDPDEAPEGLIDSLFSLAEEWGHQAVEEVAAASGSRAAADVGKLAEALSRNGVSITLPAEFARVSLGDVPPSEAPEKPWERGYRLAEQARAQLGLGTDPLGTDRLAEMLDMPVDRLRTSSGQGLPFGGSVRGDDGRLHALLSKPHPQARRFETARMIGDLIASGDLGERLYPTTRSVTARQKLQRAFAAELLFPVAAVHERCAGGPVDEEMVTALADDYDVSPLLVEHTIRNRAPDLPTSGFGI